MHDTRHTSLLEAEVSAGLYVDGIRPDGTEAPSSVAYMVGRAMPTSLYGLVEKHTPTVKSMLRYLRK